MQHNCQRKTDSVKKMKSFLSIKWARLRIDVRNEKKTTGSGLQI